MNELCLLPRENKVFFGQLLGMCDQISFPLGEKNTLSHSLTPNHTVARYWSFPPYIMLTVKAKASAGSVMAVLPYSSQLCPLRPWSPKDCTECICSSQSVGPLCDIQYENRTHEHTSVLTSCLNEVLLPALTTLFVSRRQTQRCQPLVCQCEAQVETALTGIDVNRHPFVSLLFPEG